MVSLKNNQRLSPERDLIADILDKDFKTTVLKMLKTKEVEKVKQMIHEQNGDINER